MITDAPKNHTGMCNIFKLLKFIEQFPDKQFFNGFVKSKEEESKQYEDAMKKTSDPRVMKS